ncbi:MAG: hypothetical protein PHY29_02745 [Syntrophales bacterium]|nr:hypothetical protein [Syntrophales bacterium]
MTQTDAQIISSTAHGYASREVARQTGVSPSTVQRRLRAPEIRAAVERLHDELMSTSLAEAANNIKHMIHSYQEPGLHVIKRARDGSTTEMQVFDEQLREHGFRASMEMLRSVGILPSQGTAILIQNIYNDNRTEAIPPEITTLLGRQQMVSQPVIDVEYEEIG